MRGNGIHDVAAGELLFRLGSGWRREVKILGASPEAFEISDLKLKMRSKLRGMDPREFKGSEPESARERTQESS